MGHFCLYVLHCSRAKLLFLGESMGLNFKHVSDLAEMLVVSCYFCFVILHLHIFKFLTINLTLPCFDRFVYNPLFITLFYCYFVFCAMFQCDDLWSMMTYEQEIFLLFSLILKCALRFQTSFQSLFSHFASF